MCPRAATSAPYCGHAKASRITPAASQWYWEFALQQGGMGPVVDVVGASTSGVTTVVLNFAPGTAAPSGAYGVVQRAVWGKSNMDLDRSTPDSNSPGPAFLSQLASVGEALAHWAGTDVGAFAGTLANVTALQQGAVSEVRASKSVTRANFTAALLTGSW